MQAFAASRGWTYKFSDAWKAPWGYFFAESGYLNVIQGQQNGHKIEIRDLLNSQVNGAATYVIIDGQERYFASGIGFPSIDRISKIIEQI
jgi:hypothetical protein